MLQALRRERNLLLEGGVATVVDQVQSSSVAFEEDSAKVFVAALVFAYRLAPNQRVLSRLV